PETARIAKLAMSLVNFLRERTEVKVRIGGSLSAAMFGGQREPKDIDIDIPSGGKYIVEGLTTGGDVKDRFMQLQNPKKNKLTTGKDLFVINSMDKTSSGVSLNYWHIETSKPLDPIEDNDEIEVVLKEMKETPTAYTVNVDFSSEQIFDVS